MASAIRNIVCIDDEKTILDVNKKLLEAVGGYKVACFTNGFDGIHHIKDHRPDLILLDMLMPVMDGIAVLKVLKGDKDTATIPVIFMTAQKKPEDVKKYMDMGALSVITKPIDMEDFPFQIEMLTKIVAK